MRLQRLARILYVSWKNGLLTMLVEAEPEGRMARWLGFYARRRHFSQPRAVRLRLALESLGPIFVKFGQMLSTRRDLLAPDFADELAKLQDRVPPFDSALAMAEIERGLGMPIAEAYSEFDPTPVASASVAQVHFARLHDGRDGVPAADHREAFTRGHRAGDRERARRGARRAALIRVLAVRSRGAGPGPARGRAPPHDQAD